MEFGIFVQGHVPKARVEREGPRRRAQRPDGRHRAASRRLTGTAGSTPGSASTTSSPSTRTCRRATSSSATAPRSPTASTSGRASSASTRTRTTRAASPSASRCSTTSATAASSSAPGAAPAAVRSPAATSSRTELTRAIWDEVIREIPKMWRDEEYSYEGTSFNMPVPRRSDRPPATCCRRCGSRRTRRCGWPPATRGTYVKAAQLGLGVLAFNVSAVKDMAPLVAVLQGQHRQRRAGRRLRQRQRDDHQRPRLPGRRPDGSGGGVQHGHQLPAEPGVLLPRHDAQGGGHPGVARARSPSRRSRTSSTGSRRATCCAAAPTRSSSRSPATRTSASTSSCSACRSTCRSSRRWRRSSSSASM